jgi:hypothetical protein
MREQICAPNLPNVIEQTSPSVADKSAPKWQWRQCLGPNGSPGSPRRDGRVPVALFYWTGGIQQPFSRCVNAGVIPQSMNAMIAMQAE